MPALPRAAALALITACGIGLALLGWTGVATALPRRVDLDWATRRFTALPLAHELAAALGVERRDTAPTRI